jgi:hypothetical protein
MIRKIRPLAFIVLATVLLAIMGQGLLGDIFYGNRSIEGVAPVNKSPFIESDSKYDNKVKEYGLGVSKPGTFQNVTDSNLSNAMDFLKNKLPVFNWLEFKFEEDYIFAQFVPSELENPKVLLWIALPKHMPFSYKNHTEGLEVKLACVDSKSVVLDVFMENIIETNVSVAQLLRNGGYTLITKCANIDCSEVGPVCLLVPFGSESEAKVYDFN